MNKKQNERKYLDVLLQALGVEYGEIVATEIPDFLVTISGSVVGIEITQLFHDKHHYEKKSRAWEGACEKVLKKTMAKWVEQNLPSVHVQVSFNPNEKFKLRDSRRYSNQLFELLEKILPEVNMQSVVGKHAPKSHLSHDLLVPSEYELIIVNRHEEMFYTHFSQSTGGALPDLESSLVQSRLNEKNTRIDDYKSRAKEIWLVIGIDNMRYSSSFSVTEAATESHYVSSFDRLFLLPLNSGKIFELNYEGG